MHTNASAAEQGRDSTRNLNRSLKAKKLQEKLLPSVQDLCAQLQAWGQDSGGPFILDNQDFLVRLPHYFQPAWQPGDALMSAGTVR